MKNTFSFTLDEYYLNYYGSSRALLAMLRSLARRMTLEKLPETVHTNHNARLFMLEEEFFTLHCLIGDKDINQFCELATQMILQPDHNPLTLAEFNLTKPSTTPTYKTMPTVRKAFLTDEEHKKIVDIIHDVRSKQNISLLELSKELCFANSTYLSHIVNFRKLPSQKFCESLARFLMVNDLPYPEFDAILSSKNTLPHNNTL